jgi:hypothetical protein
MSYADVRPHPWTHGLRPGEWDPVTDPMRRAARDDLRVAIEILGFEQVTQQAHEATQYARPDDRHAEREFAARMRAAAEHELELVRRRQQEAARIEAERRRRRDAAAALLLGLD